VQQNPRDFTPEEMARITATVHEHAPNFDKCPLCGTDNWGVGPGYVTLPIQPQRTSGSLLVVGWPSFPMLTIICRRCGYTVLMNIYNLGLADMFGLTPVAKPTHEVPPPPQLDDPSKPPV
jgi:hypothetical protein